MLWGKKGSELQFWGQLLGSKPLPLPLGAAGAGGGTPLLCAHLQEEGSRFPPTAGLFSELRAGAGNSPGWLRRPMSKFSDLWAPGVPLGRWGRRQSLLRWLAL